MAAHDGQMCSQLNSKQKIPKFVKKTINIKNIITYTIEHTHFQTESLM